MLSRFSHIQLFVTTRTLAHQAPLSVGFSMQEYWIGLPCLLPVDLSDPENQPASLMSPALAGRFPTVSATWEALFLQKGPINSRETKGSCGIKGIVVTINI